MLRLVVGFKIFGAGMTLACFGLIVAAASKNPGNGLIITGIGGGIGIGGISLMSSGWSMTSAKWKLNKAMQIKRLIQDVQINK